LYDLGLRQAGHVDIEIALDRVHLRLCWSKVLQPLKSLYHHKISNKVSSYLSAADVSRGQHILELVREEELLKLIGDVDRSLRDVQVTDDQNEL
jgi:hypothetical protein